MTERAESSQSVSFEELLRANIKSRKRSGAYLFGRA